jgi:peptidoglycan/LPS O-acetylase OafA/YrhL
LRLWLMARGQDVAARILMPCNLSTLLAGVVLAHATRYRGLVLPALPSPAWLRWLGRRSYAVYLFQRAAIVIPQNLLGSSLAYAALSGILVLAIAEILYHLVERPIHSWAQARWAYGEPARK